MGSEVRCPKCKKKLCEVKGTAEIDAICTRCKAKYKVIIGEPPTFTGRNGSKI